MIKLATVSPCYNEEEVLEHSVERLTQLFNHMIAEGKISNDRERRLERPHMGNH